MCQIFRTLSCSVMIQRRSIITVYSTIYVWIYASLLQEYTVYIQVALMYVKPITLWRALMINHEVTVTIFTHEHFVCINSDEYEYSMFLVIWTLWTAKVLSITVLDDKTNSQCESRKADIVPSNTKPLSFPLIHTEIWKATDRLRLFARLLSSPVVNR